jgi:protein TonB
MLRLGTALLLALFVHGCLLLLPWRPDDHVHPQLPGVRQLSLDLVSSQLAKRPQAAGQQKRAAPLPQLVEQTPAATEPQKHERKVALKVQKKKSADIVVPEKKTVTVKRAQLLPQEVKQRVVTLQSMPSVETERKLEAGTLQTIAETRSGQESPAPSPKKKDAAALEARPIYDENEPPVYPHLARKRGWQGTVLLVVQVTAKGLVEHIAVQQSSGYQLLDEAGVTAVRKWHFLPATANGLAIAMEVVVPVEFSLR